MHTAFHLEDAESLATVVNVKGSFVVCRDLREIEIGHLLPDHPDGVFPAP